MYCSNCGKEIEGGASFCPYCGSPAGNSTPVQNVNYDGTQQPPANQPYYDYQNQMNGFGYDSAPPESSGTATGALVCAFLIPIVGLILGIIGTVKYSDAKLKRRCIIAIIISIAVWALGTYLYSAVF